MRVGSAGREGGIAKHNGAIKVRPESGQGFRGAIILNVIVRQTAIVQAFFKPWMRRPHNFEHTRVAANLAPGRRPPIHAGGLTLKMLGYLPKPTATISAGYASSKLVRAVRWLIRSR